MQTICTSLQTDNHTNTSSVNAYRPDALPDAQPTVLKPWGRNETDAQNCKASAFGFKALYNIFTCYKRDAFTLCFGVRAILADSDMCARPAISHSSCCHQMACFKAKMRQIRFLRRGVAEWLACWTQAQKGLGSNRSRDAAG